VVQVDIFNLAGGPLLIAAAKAFGEEPLNGANAFPSRPPNAAPGGSILLWQGTEAAGISSAQLGGARRAGHGAC
jgi:hypothetical protein